MQHIIGLPIKNGVRHPFYDYEKMLYEALMKPGFLNSKPAHPLSRKVIYGNPKTETRADVQYQRDLMNVMHPFKDKHVWIKKSTGIGITEFMLRFMAWLCLYNDDYRNSQMVIVTGPNIDLAIKLIKRIKSLFQDKLNVIFNSKETVIELNGCSIEAYPSNHIDAFRSLTNPKFILVDECDFLPKFQQDEVRAVSERYIAKSDPFIVMVSTPNIPDGLFARIEKESFDTCLYKKIFLDYTYGLGKIYSQQEIENVRANPSFPREYELQYLGIVGNVFSELSIENSIKIEYDPDNINPNAKKTIGL